VPAEELAGIYMEEWQGQLQEKVFQLVWQSQKSEVATLFKRELSTEEMGKIESITREVFFLYIPANVWKDALRDYFQKHLSMQEQLDSLAFLQSAAGKKFLSMQIQTGNEVGGQVARHLHQHQEDFGDSLAKRLTAEFPELLR
jgi:hypothetical protein